MSRVHVCHSLRGIHQALLSPGVQDARLRQGKCLSTVSFMCRQVSRRFLRTSLIVGLCLCGFAFSLPGVALAWRRLRSGGMEMFR